MPVKVEKKLFKDAIDKPAITKLATALGNSWPDFPQVKFIKYKYLRPGYTFVILKV